MKTNNCENTDQILQKFTETTLMFQALGDPIRQQMIILLLKNKEMTVNQITENVSISRPAVSHHLKILRQADLVAFDKKGNEKYYTLLSEEFVKHFSELIALVKESH